MSIESGPVRNTNASAGGFTQVQFGAAYYHEYQPTPRLQQDIEEMRAAGFTVIRVGESVWSTWEPEDGVYDLEWITPVLDAAHEHGIGVILGTPTYAIPPWLQRRYPEINVRVGTDRPLGWGLRQEIDVAHAAFRFHAERVVRAILDRHAEHPAIVGFQVDNEPGAWPMFNDDVFERFRDHLRNRYGSVETINREWGLTYWSHRLSDWSDLWRPDVNSLPQYALAWMSFQADLLTEYMQWQTAIVREYSGNRFVMTCMSYGRPTLRDDAVGAVMTVTAGNPYFKAQDALELPSTDVLPQQWWTQGTWGLYHSADWMYGTKHEPFLVTEVGAGSIGLSSMNHPAYPGQRRQSVWALISRGAKMIEYWHWHTLHWGPETYWGGVLPHSQQPGRTYHELAAIGQELEQLGDRILDLTPDAHVGLLYDYSSKWALSGHGPLPGAGDFGREDSYSPFVQAFERGIFDAGLQTRLFHTSSLLQHDPEEVARTVPIFVAAAYYTAADDVVEWLAAYARAGGRLVIGPRTGYADLEARARVERAPGRLGVLAGAWYDEFSNLDGPVPVRAAVDGWDLPTDAAALAWAESYKVEADAEVLARYEHPFHGRFAAVTSRTVGHGRAVIIGTLPNPQFAEALFRYLADETGIDVPVETGSSVRVHTAVNRRGERLHIVQNWSWQPADYRPPASATELHTGQPVKTTEPVRLEAWDVRVFATTASDDAPSKETA